MGVLTARISGQNPQGVLQPDGILTPRTRVVREGRKRGQGASAQPLTLDPSLSAPTSTTVLAPVDTVVPVDTVPPTSSTLPSIQPPAPLTPLISPALEMEGAWQPIAQAGGLDAMWATSIRPLPEYGGVVASMVVIDQTNLRVGLFNGSELPGGSWARGNHVPKDLYPALIGAMNGGFRFDHIKGGYFTEGKVVKALRDGDATLAIGRDGRMVLGALGRDFTNDGSWVSMRQNLILLVDGGQSQVQLGASQGVWWGADYGNEVYVPRTAVCELVDGRLAFTFMVKVDVQQLAQSLINMGCTKAMQMDINGTWPAFFTYRHEADGSLSPTYLDQRMEAAPRRYLNGSSKEFFAFFDTGLVPTGSVLDA